MKLFHVIILAIAISFLTGCITEYEHPGIKHMSGLLVVEGIITNDTTFVSLSRSVGLDETIYSPDYISGALVSVESEGGASFPAVEYETGRYYMLTGTLDSSAKYRLKIESEGYVYASEYLEPINTPDVTNLELYKRQQGADVNLLVSTVNTEDGSRFYLWSYDEIWEYSAEYMATSYQIPELNGHYENADPQDRQILDYYPYSPYYYCWAYDSSNSLQIGSSANLSENRIEKLSIGNFDPSSDRFSILYYVRLKQNCIRKEAYDNFSNLKENTENTGSIFGPVPSEMKGNIVCLTDESIPVIGYIEVSTTAVYEKLFSSFRNLYEYQGSSCYSVEDADQAEEMGLDWNMLTIYYEGFMDPNLYTSPRCIDCRRPGGYHDRKPEFWPNNHI